MYSRLNNTNILLKTQLIIIVETRHFNKLYTHKKGVKICMMVFDFSEVVGK